MTKTDAHDIFKYTRIMLNLTRTWPKPNASTSYKLIGFSTYVFAVILNVLAFVQIYIDFEGTESLTYVVFLNLAIVFYLPKVAMFFYKRHEFYKILENLTHPVFKSYQDYLDVYMKGKVGIFTKLQLGFQILAFSTLFLIDLLPFYGKRFDRSLPVPFPFDLKRQPMSIYIIFWGLQIYILNVCALSGTSLDILACSFMAIASAQLEILREKLKHVADSDKENRKTSKTFVYGSHDSQILLKLKNCVQHHIEIERLVKSIDKTFTYMFLIQLLSSISMICIAEFNFILVPLASVQFWVSFLFFGCVMTQTAIYCAFGNDVIVQSSKIGEACYTSEWPECSNRIQKSLFIIMERSKRPYVLTAGKFITLSINSFLTVVKSSFSYFTFLQKLYNKANGN